MYIKSDVQEIVMKITSGFMLLFFIFIPSFYLLSFIITRWEEILNEIFMHPILGSTYWNEITRCLSLSLRLSLFTVLIDLTFGIPLALLLARKRFPGMSIVENLTMLPLVIPTSGFGLATMLAWTASYSLSALLGLKIGIDTIVPIIKVPFLMLIIHISLTFPYIVKTVSGALRDMRNAYEIMSSSLGAKPLTIFRKITMPMIIPSILSGSVLAFARSLGETGATMMVAGVSTTAPIAIVKWEFENKLAPAAFLGALLVAMSLIVILPAEILSERVRRGRRLLPLGLEVKIVRLERKIPSSLSYLRDFIPLVALGLLVIMPILTLIYNAAIYWHADPFTGNYEGGILFQLFGPSRYFSLITRSILTSFLVAGIATFISAYIAILTVPAIVKSKYGNILRVLLKVPLVIPTSALGLSMILLWGDKGLGLMAPGFWLIVLTHIVFSSPVIIETTLASYLESRLALYEETARSLGATLYDVLETITIPLTRRGLLVGALLAFTHSLGETGATFIVMGDHITVSTLIVNLVESLAIPASIFASLLLIITSIVLISLIRIISKG